MDLKFDLALLPEKESVHIRKKTLRKILMHQFTRVESTQFVPFENALQSMPVHGTSFHKGYEKDVRCGF